MKIRFYINDIYLIFLWQVVSFLSSQSDYSENWNPKQFQFTLY